MKKKKKNLQKTKIREIKTKHTGESLNKDLSLWSRVKNNYKVINFIFFKTIAKSLVKASFLIDSIKNKKDTEKKKKKFKGHSRFAK